MRARCAHDIAHNARTMPCAAGLVGGSKATGCTIFGKIRHCVPGYVFPYLFPYLFPEFPYLFITYMLCLRVGRPGGESEVKRPIGCEWGSVLFGPI